MTSLQGAGSLSLETPEISQSGSFAVTLLKPDSILVKLEGPFGIQVGAALITRKDFLFYNSLANQAISGDMNAENLSRALNMPLSFDDLVNLFAGGAFLVDDRPDGQQVAAEDDQLLLTFRDGDVTRRYVIDPTLLLITRVEHLDSRGRLFLEQRYSSFRTVEGVSVPSVMRLTQHRERRMLTVRYRQLSVNGPAGSLSLSIPPSATRIRLQ